MSFEAVLRLHYTLPRYISRRKAGLRKHLWKYPVLRDRKSNLSIIVPMVAWGSNSIIHRLIKRFGRKKSYCMLPTSSSTCGSRIDIAIPADEPILYHLKKPQPLSNNYPYLPPTRLRFLHLLSPRRGTLRTKARSKSVCCAHVVVAPSTRSSRSSCSSTCTRSVCSNHHNTRSDLRRTASSSPHYSRQERLRS